MKWWSYAKRSQSTVEILSGHLSLSIAQLLKSKALASGAVSHDITWRYRDRVLGQSVIKVRAHEYVDVSIVSTGKTYSLRVVTIDNKRRQQWPRRIKREAWRCRCWRSVEVVYYSGRCDAWVCNTCAIKDMRSSAGEIG